MNFVWEIIEKLVALPELLIITAPYLVKLFCVTCVPSPSRTTLRGSLAPSPSFSRPFLWNSSYVATTSAFLIVRAEFQTLTGRRPPPAEWMLWLAPAVVMVLVVVPAAGPEVEPPFGRSWNVNIRRLSHIRLMKTDLVSKNFAAKIQFLIQGWHNKH